MWDREEIGFLSLFFILGKENEVCMKEIVMVTGASRGIGCAVADRFAREGHPVVITASKKEEELKVAGERMEQYGGKVLRFLADVGDYEQMREVVGSVERRLGEVGILVNNAGVAWIGLFQEMEYLAYEQMVRTNLLSVMHGSHLVIPGMIRRKAGKIINISSVWGNVGASCEAVYSATKSGINGFTRALGKELAPSHIQVNALACGVIDTQMNGCLSEEEREALKEEIPAGRFGRAEEVAELVYQIAVGHEYLNGQVIALDGGWI